MAETGITKGTSATTFSPAREMTRAEFATFLWRYATQLGTTTASVDTTDTTSTDNAITAVSVDVPATAQKAARNALFRLEHSRLGAIKYVTDQNFTAEVAETVVDKHHTPAIEQANALIQAKHPLDSTADPGYLKDSKLEVIRHLKGRLDFSHTDAMNAVNSVHTPEIEQQNAIAKARDLFNNPKKDYSPEQVISKLKKWKFASDIARIAFDKLSSERHPDDAICGYRAGGRSSPHRLRIY